MTIKFNRSGGVKTARRLVNEVWQSKFAAMVDIIKEQGLPEYEGLWEKVIPEDDPEAAELAKFVGAHERIILLVCENVVNKVPNPTSPLDNFLHLQLVKAPPFKINNANDLNKNYLISSQPTGLQGDHCGTLLWCGNRSAWCLTI